MTAPTDEELLREYLSGDLSAFELLVRRHAPELHQFAMRFTSDSVAAEDVVQETLLQIHNSAESFDPTKRFKPWLFTIAANKARDYLRRRTRRREVPFEAQISGESDSTRRFIELLSGDEDIPEDDLLADEKRRIVRELVERMPDKLKDVLILAYFHKFSYQDIGEVLGIPLGTVKSRLHAAVVWFADNYKDLLKQRIGEGDDETETAKKSPRKSD